MQGFLLSEKSKTFLLNLLSLSLLLAGSAYLLFLHSMFPTLVPGYGGGERFTLSEANDFTFQIPWEAYSRLHLNLQANDTLEIYVDGDYVCDCVQYELVLERGDDIMLMMKSSSPVRGRFTARQEIPLEKQLLAYFMILAGIAGLALSIVWARNR